MNILWISNMLLPEAAKYLNVKTSVSGTWMFDLANKLSNTDGINLIIACVYGNEYKEVKVNKITYILLPGNGKNMLFYTKEYENYWRKINEKYKPDLVHLHGTEYSHGLSFLRALPEVPALLSIQGVVEKIAHHMNDELTISNLIKHRTLKDYLKLNGLIERKILFKKNSRYEKEIISRVKYATGRTDWDKFYMQAVNRDLKYYRCNYNVRDEFYSAPKWDIDKIERHTIYGTTSAQTPLKGGHVLLRALVIVKDRYPDVKLRFLMPGYKNGEFTKKSEYNRLILRFIKDNALENNVEFLPSQNSEGVIKYMNKSHIAVIPSAMENASATLRESMHLGVPSIASFRGGMTHLIRDGIDGFFFDYSEHEYLAGRIMQIFEDDELAVKLSKNAVEVAEVWHDREKNPNDFVEMYNDIIQKRKELTK